MRAAKSQTIVLILGLMAFLSHEAYATAHGTIELRSITTPAAKKERINFSDFQVISFFQENCSHCESQLKELPCFKDKGFKVAAIGIGTAPIKLRQILTKNAKDIDGYAMDIGLASELSIKGTPVTFLKLRSEPKFKRFDGYVRCDSIEN